MGSSRLERGRDGQASRNFFSVPEHTHTQTHITETFICLLSSFFVSNPHSSIPQTVLSTPSHHITLGLFPIHIGSSCPHHKQTNPTKTTTTALSHSHSEMTNSSPRSFTFSASSGTPTPTTPTFDLYTYSNSTASYYETMRQWDDEGISQWLQEIKMTHYDRLFFGTTMPQPLSLVPKMNQRNDNTETENTYAYAYSLLYLSWLFCCALLNFFSRFYLV